MAYPKPKYGLIGKIRAVQGSTGDLIEVLTAGSNDMPGCLSYVVARDPADPDAVWVTEVWVDQASHKASLQLPSVQAAIARGRPLIAGFEQHVETVPADGSRLSPSAGHVSERTQLFELQRHSTWADARLLNALRDAAASVPEAVRELAHVRGSQETWLARIEGRRPSLEVWPELSLDELDRVGSELDRAWLDLVSGLDSDALDRVIAYENNSGVSTESVVSDILLAVIVHSQYHRGKVNVALRVAGAEPVLVDYMAWRRLGSPTAEPPRQPPRRGPLEP